MYLQEYYITIDACGLPNPCAMCGSTTVTTSRAFERPCFPPVTVCRRRSPASACSTQSARACCPGRPRTRSRRCACGRWHTRARWRPPRGAGGSAPAPRVPVITSAAGRAGGARECQLRATRRCQGRGLGGGQRHRLSRVRSYRLSILKKAGESLTV